MTYPKPAGVSYTQMAIYIDEHIYSDTKDEEKLYIYMYHLAIMLATESAYYSTAEQYDQFGLFCATRLYLRYTNPKQFQMNDDGSPKMKRIKSVLNYIKRVINFAICINTHTIGYIRHIFVKIVYLRFLCQN